jgi:hypothetical protein
MEIIHCSFFFVYIYQVGRCSCMIPMVSPSKVLIVWSQRFKSSLSWKSDP